MAVVQVPYTKLTSLNIGSSVTIKGTPAMSFIMSPELQVDFHTGTQEDSDIAFSFRVYFGNCVVMNSRQFGDWKAEEKYEGMPFVDGQPFELCISVLQNEYQIKVNGRQCYTFSHRLPPNSVKMIQVWRDVSLTSVVVQ
ncbi:galactoside-binding soluble lectin 13-like isoform X2 [Pipistrellus kuhlii]|uniref:galactoside-binding soluble lectin 13-like isoform X2 n=1 Tax=Pipistrellus kuhlii TaxID=59472 RepID=UPI001E27294A|nr:galactoside-binding soluble lectin 13-like isoform X2 [Pipistrellus kuhlii]